MDSGQTMLFNLNAETTTFHGLLDMVSKEVGHRIADLIILDETGASPDGNKNLSDYDTIGNATNPVYLFLKSGNDREKDNCSDVTYIFQMIDDAVEQAQYVLKNPDPLKIYMELPDRAKNCRKVCGESLQMCATLVQQHRYLHKGWLALINNLDTSVSRMDKRGKKFKTIHMKMEELIEKSESLLLNYTDVIEQLRLIEVPTEILVKPAPLMASTTTPINSEEKCTLFDFISRADPNSSLEDLPDMAHEKIRQLKEHNVKNVYTTIQSVHEQSKNQEFRDFKGINKRFSQLEFSLKSCEERKEKVHRLVAAIVETPKISDQSRLPPIIDDHKRYMQGIFDCFVEFRNMVRVFDQSKQEILKNLRTRMSGFVVQSYDRLRNVLNDIVQFEYKGNAVRIHMDLIGQIRDAPILYSQSVSEIVRRRLLKTELDDWHTDHSSKCGMFSSDEEKTREQLGRKLKKHFLHALFPSLFDSLPEFYVKAPLEKYDTDLPNIAKDYIRELREAIPELEPYLKVTLPNVAGKLATKGSKAHPPFGQTRVESFLTEEPMRMARSHFNYSPAAWLSEDGGDSSPIPQTLMCRSPDNALRESQCRSIPYVPSLQQLEGLDGPAPGTSAPISIPNASSSRINFKNRQMSSQDLHHVGSAVSSDTSILGPETPVKVEDTVARIEKQQEELQQQSDMSESNESIDSLMDVYEHIDYSAEDILIGLSDHTAQLEDAVKRLGKMQNLVANMQPRNEKLFKYLHQTAPRDFELIIHDGDKLKNRVKELGESVESLETELESRKSTETGLEAKLAEMTTSHKKEIEETQAECIKRMSVEFELMTDSMSRQNKEQMESKDREIEELKNKLEKQTIAHEKALRNDPYTEEYKRNLTAEIRAELEKEFKQRIEVITKAVECKKDEAFARQEKTLEIENRVLSSENEVKSKKLEGMSFEIEQLESLIRTMPDGELILEEFSALKESQPSVQIKDKFAAIRSRMDKSLDSRCLDNNKVFLIDNILKIHKLQQLVDERLKYKDIIKAQAGGDEVLKCLETYTPVVAVDMDGFWKEMTAYSGTFDEAGRKINKMNELEMETVWLHALVRANPTGPFIKDISEEVHKENHQKDVETVTSISMMDIFMDHDREEIKKLARTMQMWLNAYVISQRSAATYAIEDSPKIKECALKYKSNAMKISTYPGMEESFFQPMVASTIHNTSGPSELSLEVERSSQTTVCTQTRLCLPAMNLLISVQDIKTGSAVLVIWHQVHNAYVIFCSSPHRFFVKESSIRRLGINTQDPSTRRNWLLAKVVRSDSCSIKKPVNRYNLAVGTIVRRVEVEAMHMDFEGDFQKISIA